MGPTTAPVDVHAPFFIRVADAEPSIEIEWERWLSNPPKAVTSIVPDASHDDGEGLWASVFMIWDEGPADLIGDGATLAQA